MFRRWTPKGQDFPVHFYSLDFPGCYVTVHKGQLQIKAKDGQDHSRAIRDTLESYGIDGNITSIRALEEALNVSGLLTLEDSPQYQSGRSNSTQSNKMPTRFESNTMTQIALAAAASELEISNIRYKAVTEKQAIITVDHREPKALSRLLAETPLCVEVGHLGEGDILITCRDDTKRSLLIERKTVTDLSNGIRSETAHCHEQAERYYSLAQEFARDGRLLKVVWIVEGEQEGARLLYNALPQIQQMDGWINYLVAILNQHVLQTYNMHHTAYLVAKLAQGFLEQSLTYPVKSGSIRIDRSQKERHTLEVSSLVQDGPSTRGLIHANYSLRDLLTLMPGINKRVAEQLANTGMSLAQITQLSIEELKNVKGVADKTAILIYESFHRTDR